MILLHSEGLKIGEKNGGEPSDISPSFNFEHRNLSNVFFDCGGGLLRAGILSNHVQGWASIKETRVAVFFTSIQLSQFVILCFRFCVFS